MKRLTPILSVAILFASAGAVYACPSCKESIPTSDAADPAGVARGINNSVYFMLGAFLAILGFVGHISYKAIKSSDAVPCKVKAPVPLTIRFSIPVKEVGSVPVTVAVDSVTVVAVAPLTIVRLSEAVGSPP